jgi:hypothetical protein
MTIIPPLILLMLFAAPRSSSGETGRTTAPPVTWLPGCWRTSSGGTSTVEMWMQAEGGLLLGVSRTVRDGRAVWFEHLRIAERGDSLLYIAHPSGQSEAEFLLVESDSSTLAFANPHHDFPRRITYHFPGPDTLAVKIEGPGRNGTRTSWFTYRRTGCP